jgi:hypothetical protein
MRYSELAQMLQWVLSARDLLKPRASLSRDNATLSAEWTFARPAMRLMEPKA